MKKITSFFIVIILMFSFSLSVCAADSSGDDGGIVSGFLNGLKDLFIPSEEFFNQFNTDIQTAIDKKTGGMSSTFKSVTDQFDRLNDTREVSTLKFNVPDGLFFSGYHGVSVDFLQGIDKFLVWFRGIFSAVLVLFTVISCYKKTAALFKK